MKCNAFNQGGRYFGLPPKMLLIMKLIIVILTVCLSSVYANSKGQVITLSEKNVSLKKVLSAIKKQSGYDIVYADRLLDGKLSSVKLVSAGLSTALEEALRGQELSYEILDRTVVIKAKEKSFLERIVDRFMAIEVRGKVVDKDGNPLVGASVKLKGTGQAVITGANGEFSFSGVNENETLIITYIGYESREASVKSNLEKIILIAALSRLDEVQVIAYGTTTKRLSTGNISSVKGDDLTKQPVTNVLAALQSKVPGLYIEQTTGVPGGAFTVRLRGQNSILNGNDPLYIVNGVPFASTSTSIGSNPMNGGSPFNSLNINDIERIDVLKDADATAIYGSRGANGVILITTKQGKAGKTQFDLNYYAGASVAANRMKLLNTEQYLEMRNEAFKNDNVVPTTANAPDLLVWDKNQYINWQELLVGQTARTNDLQLSFSGGSSSTQFRLGGNYRRESTVFKGDSFEEKATGLLSINHVSPSARLRLGASVNYSFVGDNLPVSDPSRYITLAPNIPNPIDEQGNLYWGPAGATFQNPLAYLKEVYASDHKTLIANGSISYELFPRLILRSTFGITSVAREEIAKTPFASLDPNSTTSERSSISGKGRSSGFIIEPQLNYSVSFKAHSLDFLLGSTLQQDKRSFFQIKGVGFTSDALLENFQSIPVTGLTVNSDRQTDYKYNSIFARITYDYDTKYLLNLSARRDGSSRFGPGKQFSNFGALGAGWVFSQERFIKDNLPFLSFGKVRGSIGTSGNDQLTDYQFLDSYSSGTRNYQGIAGITPTRLFNPDFAWEQNTKAELGLELGFLKNRILLSAGYFRNRSSNQLVGYDLPPTTGFANIQYNLPATVENKGFELELHTINVDLKPLKWTTSFNLTVPKNTLLKYPGLDISTFAARYSLGKSLFVANVLPFSRVNPETGVYEFLDKSGQPTSKPSSTADRQFLDEITQEFYGGLQNSISFKGIEFGFNFQFVKQKGRNYLYWFPSPGLVGRNQPVAVLDRWQVGTTNSNALVQRFTQSTASNAYSAYSSVQNYGSNTIEDASFIRLKNVSLSYRLPQQWLDKAKVNMVRIYVQGQNLWTITFFKVMDPESRSILSLPPLRALTAGIQLNL